MAGLTRRRFLASAASLAAGGTAAGFAARASGQSFVDGAGLPGPYATPQWPLTDVGISPAVEQAIEKGLQYLGKRLREDGSIGSGGYPRNIAVASLAGMSFIASGSTPGRGPWGEHVTRCLDFVLTAATPDGMIIEPSSASYGPMYGHGFSTLFLAEVFGMSPDTQVRQALTRAVRLIVAAQNDEGGWRYKPASADADVSVTVCQFMALRAARNAGVGVPAVMINQAIDYIKRCQNPDGGFMYTLQQGGPSAFPRSAAAVTALFAAGLHDDKAVAAGLDYLVHNAPKSASSDHESRYFYAQYYMAQAMWHAGADVFRQWYAAASDFLVAQQRQDGSWQGDICPEYCAAMATLALQMPNNYLPIFQR